MNLNSLSSFSRPGSRRRTEKLEEVPIKPSGVPIVGVIALHLCAVLFLAVNCRDYNAVLCFIYVRNAAANSLSITLSRSGGTARVGVVLGSQPAISSDVVQIRAIVNLYPPLGRYIKYFHGDYYLLSGCGGLAASCKCDFSVFHKQWVPSDKLVFLVVTASEMWFIKFASFFLLLQLGCTDQQKPHIIVIVADDMVSLSIS